MFILLLLLISSASADSSPIVNITQKWVINIEELLTRVSIGPLKDEITPTYLGRRTAQGALDSQISVFRARVAHSMLACRTNRAVICIEPTVTDDDAVQSVHDELIAHNFTVTWAKTHGACPQYGKLGGSALLVNLPEPTKAAE